MRRLAASVRCLNGRIHGRSNASRARGKLHLALAELSGVIPEEKYEIECYHAAVAALSEADQLLAAATGERGSC